jgi:hypothetical protein
MTPVEPTSTAHFERRLRAHLANLRTLLGENVDSARDILRKLLVGPLRFTPITENRRRAYAFEGEIALDRLVSGVIELRALTGVASPAGFEPAF